MLLNLHYFDVIRFHTIDPMHCIFLGISKCTVKLWKENNILNEHSFEMLQEKVHSMNEHSFEMLQDKVHSIIVSPNIGRILKKVKSGFASFTAEALDFNVCPV